MKWFQIRPRPEVTNKTKETPSFETIIISPPISMGAVKNGCISNSRYLTNFKCAPPLSTEPGLLQKHYCTLPELTCSSLKIGHPIRKTHLSTIDFRKRNSLSVCDTGIGVATFFSTTNSVNWQRLMSVKQAYGRYVRLFCCRCR